MIPFYTPFYFYNACPAPTLFNPFGMVQQQQKHQLREVMPSIKQEQQRLEYQISEKESQSEEFIELDANELEKQGYKVTKRLWSEEQDRLLIRSVEEENLNWKQISKLVGNRNPKMCYNRYKRLCKKKKILWSKQQDQKLKYLVQQRKIKWKHLESHFQNRKAKQLRERYLNFLRSNISRQPWTLEQDLKLIQCINSMGKKWKNIEQVLTRRSENQIKNRYYGRIKQIMKKKEKEEKSE